MKYDFSGKIILVTGATSGIGQTTAVEFAKCGGTVIASGRREVSNPLFADFIHCDVSKEDEVKSLIEQIAEKYGQLDIAFNCAGVGPDGVRLPYTTLTDTSLENWTKTIDVNLTGTFLCLKHELIQMQKQGHGVIVNTSSTGGDRFAPGFNAYGPSKVGVIALTELASNENARKGIRVNCICPGPTYGTELMNNSIKTSENMEADMKNRVIPMGKFGTQEEVAEAVLWLSSDLSSHTTGQSLFIDGGMHVKP